MSAPVELSSKLAPAPLLTGRDLLAMGCPQGARLGKLYAMLYDEQLDETLLTRRQALQRARALFTSL